MFSWLFPTLSPKFSRLHFYRFYPINNIQILNLFSCLLLQFYPRRMMVFRNGVLLEIIAHFDHITIKTRSNIISIRNGRNRWKPKFTRRGGIRFADKIWIGEGRNRNPWSIEQNFYIPRVSYEWSFITHTKCSNIFDRWSCWYWINPWYWNRNGRFTESIVYV